MLGFMLVTAFLSMFLSNTATTAMMMPIANAILEEMRKNKGDAKGRKGGVRRGLRRVWEVRGEQEKGEECGKEGRSVDRREECEKEREEGGKGGV